MLQAVAEFRVGALRERIKSELAKVRQLSNEMDNLREDIRFASKRVRDDFAKWQARTTDPPYAGIYRVYLHDQVHRYAALLEMLDLTTDDIIQLDTDVVLNVLLGE